jgi:hypothetical protein
MDVLVLCVVYDGRSDVLIDEEEERQTKAEAHADKIGGQRQFPHRSHCHERYLGAHFECVLCKADGCE